MLGLGPRVVLRYCVWIHSNIRISKHGTTEIILRHCDEMLINIYDDFLPNVFFISSSSNMTYHVPPWQHWCLAVRPVLWPSGKSWGNEGRKYSATRTCSNKALFLFMIEQFPMQPMRHHVTYVTYSPIGWDLAQPYIKNVMCDNKANSPEIDIHIAKRLRAWQFSIRSYRSKIAENGCSTATRGVTETKMLLFWWHFHSWLNWKVSFYQNDNIFVTVFYNCLSTKRISMIFGENVGALML